MSNSQITTTAINQKANNIIAANHNNNNSNNNHHNENILCAVLALLKELDDSGLELVKRDIERKIIQKRQG